MSPEATQRAGGSPAEQRGLASVLRRVCCECVTLGAGEGRAEGGSSPGRALQDEGVGPPDYLTNYSEGEAPRPEMRRG